MNMTLSEELQWRGFVNQTTFKDITVLDKEKLTFYWGVDPSAKSMQVGNFAIAMMVRHFISHGHKAVLLVGGATGMIGDPDGKGEERQLKSLEEVAANKAGITQQYKNVFNGEDFTLVDNYDWFHDIGYLQFLREVGKHLSMTQLLDREFVQSRIGEGGAGISYAEFSYSLIQGYDFLHLFREHGVTLQLCGADQWGNSLSGVEMIRKLESAEAHVWSAPLVINKATGKKFGKSEEGAVWLDPEMTSPYKFYQFWLNSDDEGVIEYMKIYTLLPKKEVDRLETAVRERPHEREAQKVLAYEVTKLVHGEQRADSVTRVTEVLFGGRSIDDLNDADIEALAQEIPSAQSGGNLSAVLVASGTVASNSEARRLISGGAISVDGEKADSDRVVNRRGLVKKGKNSFILIR
jgi:tyrosyl-tRNA synthetase